LADSGVNGSARKLHQGCTESDHNGLGSIPGLQFLENIFNVRLHGLQGDVEHFGDLGAAESIHDRLKDFRFARAQQTFGVTGFGCCLACA
jgi:hypothetical protein